MCTLALRLVCGAVLPGPLCRCTRSASLCRDLPWQKAKKALPKRWISAPITPTFCRRTEPSVPPPRKSLPLCRRLRADEGRYCRRCAGIALRAKYTRETVKQNAAFALLAKGAVLVAAAFAHAPVWLAIFADAGVALLCVLNATRTIAVK